MKNENTQATWWGFDSTGDNLANKISLGETFLAWNPNEAELTINKNMRVQFEKMPSRWHRFWYRVLLGWTWRKL